MTGHGLAAPLRAASTRAEASLVSASRPTPWRCAPLRLVVFALIALTLALPVAVRAGLIPAPPQVLAMWNGKDGASVRAQLHRIAAGGDTPGVTAAQKLDAGESAYWLGVQDMRAGRPDSALAMYRRAVALRGDFDEGFALIDMLARSGRPADLAEARSLAEMLAMQANMSDSKRAPEAHARLAWVLHQLDRSAEAAGELRDHALELYRRAAWTRRFFEIQRAGGDDANAWRALVLLSARARRQDAVVETLLVQLQHRLHYNDDRRQIAVSIILDRVLAEEQAFAQSLHGAVETMRAKDGFPLQVFTFAAAKDSVRRAPVLFVPAATDTVAAVDSLVFALTRAGHPVAVLSPRGTFGSVAPAAWGSNAWLGREAAFLSTTTADAGVVMDALAKLPAFASRGWIVGATGDRAPIALELARARRNTPALLLVAPRLPLVEIAEFRARLHLSGVRTFVQVAPEEQDALELADLLARDTKPGQVRVVDSGLAGRGAAIFRGDAKVTRRLLAWLEERRAR